ncbi:hypothetical protein CRYUN_Cryun32bG0101600 [Craigia yunnanensis]
MLPRSSSTPILNSWLPHSKDSLSSEPDFSILQRTRSVFFNSPSSVDDHKQKLTQNLADMNIQNDTPKPRKKKGRAIIPTPHSLDKQAKQERNDGGKICGGAAGGGSDGGDDGGGSGFFESNNHGSDSTDVYYQKMIEANPGNPLLLGNYAKFLKEITADFARAEEYCGRAILANLNDGNILSLYADLIWQNQKDSHRAKSYFDQAVTTAPDNCFVLTSYAKFLWDTEEHDKSGKETEHNHIPPPDFFLRPPQHPSITAAS